MSEELIQRNLVNKPERMGTWDYYNIGATSLKALKNAKIIPQKDYGKFEGKKPDALVVKKPLVIAAVEYKKPGELKTERQIKNAIDQEIGTARALGAKVYVVTDGRKTFWINPLTCNPILAENGEPITTVFEQHSKECVKLISKIISSISKDNDTLFSPSVVDPLPLAQRVWQDLWAVSGATPENCLYTFVELFIFKYLSDLGVLQGLYSFSNLLVQYGNNSDNAVLEYYASTVRPEIKKRFPKSDRDGTTIINGTIFVSKDDTSVDGYSAVFRKILERFEAFGTLENIDYDFKSKLFETFLKESISKKNWGQFFTPLKVVRSIVSMADIRPNMSICDPACGVGKFLLEPILHDISRYFKIEQGQLVRQITLSGFDKGFDKDEQKTIILAKANMLIYLSTLIRDNPGLTVDFAKLFNDTFLLQTNSILGTLAHPIENEYDLILTNPPYVMSGSANLKNEISNRAGLKRYFSVNAMGIEGLFMEWIIRALKPGGKAFVVVPDGIMNRSNDKRLRDFILEECEIDAVISLPINTFFTTNKKTYILAVTKKNAVIRDGIEVKARQTSPVFTYLCSEIGETRDTYRFDMEENNLAEAAKSFNMFKGNRAYFTTPDKRCKIVSVDEFYNDSHWSVERWWMREERIELGIEEEIESVTLEGFLDIIDDTAIMLMQLEEPIRELIKKKEQRSNIGLRVSDVFDLSITTNGSRFTKSFINKYSGDIPVYGASKNETDVGYGYIKDGIKGVKYFSDCLTWNIDGSFGLFIRKGKFSLSEKVIPLILKEEYRGRLLLEFLRVAITTEVLKTPFTFTNKGGKTRFGLIKVQIPVKPDGEFDINAQKAVAAQFELTEQIKAEIGTKRKRIKIIPVTIDLSTYSMVYMPVTELFTIERGNGKYTKTYTQKHLGDYPLYSGNTFGEFAFIDGYDYDTPCLTWAIDGLAGYMMAHSDPFSATNHRGILLPKTADIDINYFKFALEPLFRQVKKGRIGDNGENEYTSLPPFMLKDIEVGVPVDEQGKISLELQHEIAAMYDTIEQYRRKILGKLDSLLAKHIEY